MKLSASKLRELRGAEAINGSRLAKAIDLADLTQAETADGVSLTQPYVSDVARGRHDTITVDNARKFAAFFGCAIEDLNPAREQSVAS